MPHSSKSLIRFIVLAALLPAALLSPVPAKAWQTPAIPTTAAAFEGTLLDTADDGLAFQNQAPAKPTVPPKTTPQPTAPTTRPTNVPPAPAPAAPQPQFNPFANQQANRPYLARMSRAPDMFGDSFGSLTVNTQVTATAAIQTTTDLPIAGGSRQFKNEHSRALPTDRVFGLYHHFDDALQSSSPNGAFATRSANLDRFTAGVEKTFFEGNASVELRMPLSVPVTLSSPGSNYRMESVGDFVVTFKGLLYADDSQAVALGLAVNTPTGSDLTVNLPTGGVSDFTLKNDAVHLIPFLAYQAAPTEDFFFNGFLQFDTPTNSNTVRVRDSATTSVEDVAVKTQTLMFVDASFGYWLFRDPDADFLTGLASVLELHYTTALNDADFVQDSKRIVTFGAGNNRFDVINLTAGLQANIAESTTVRVGYVTPLRGGDNRFFDHEITVAVVFRR